MANIVKFPKAFLRDELDLPSEAKERTLVDVDDHGVSTHDVIFAHDGRFYCFAMDVIPSWGIDWSNMEDEVECAEVRQVEKVVKAWESVEGEEAN